MYSLDHLLQWLSRVISTKERKKERKPRSQHTRSQSWKAAYSSGTVTGGSPKNPWTLTQGVYGSRQRRGSREKGRDGHCNLKRISVIAKRQKENDFRSRERVLRTCHASHGPIPFGISGVTWRPWHEWVCVGLISDGSRITSPFLILVKVDMWYGVATISRLLKIIGLFCRISSLL